MASIPTNLAVPQPNEPGQVIIPPVPPAPPDNGVNGKGHLPRGVWRSSALILIERGIPFTLLRPKTKSAYIDGWPDKVFKSIQEAEPFAISEDCNVAAVAKANLDGVWFFEVDSRNVIQQIKADTGHSMPKTLTVKSRDGHAAFYFRQTTASLELGNVPQLYGDFSVRVDDEYIVGPLSLHPLTEKAYEIVVDAPLVEGPGWLLEWIRAKQNKKEGSAATEVIRNEAGLVEHGNVHPWLVKHAGELRAVGLNADEIESALLRFAHETCAEPLDDSKIIAIAKSIGKYPVPSNEPIYLDGKIPGAAQQKVKSRQAAESVEITDEMLDREFPAYDGKDVGPIPMLIENFLPKGANFFGSLSGVGKTWLGLSVAKALTSGEPLFGVFPVKEQVAVLYLIPEASDGTFKNRLKLMKITRDKTLFRYRTVSQGVTLSLRDPLTVKMIQKLRQHWRRQVLVIADTAIRFLEADDENASTQNSLVGDSDYLRSKDIGADLLFMHHSPKESKKAAELTLENVLRGTGDFGAMADVVYGIRRDENLYAYGEGPEELDVVCVKPRDLENPPLPFRVVLKRKDTAGGRPVSVINETGDVVYVGPEAVKSKAGNLLDFTLRTDPYTSLNSLTKVLKMRRELVKDLAKSRGWSQAAEVVFGPVGAALKASNGLDKKRFRWTQITVAGQLESVVTEPKPSSESTTESESAEVDEVIQF